MSAQRLPFDVLGEYADCGIPAMIRMTTDGLLVLYSRYANPPPLGGGDPECPVLSAAQADLKPTLVRLRPDRSAVLVADSSGAQAPIASVAVADDLVEYAYLRWHLGTANFSIVRRVAGGTTISTFGPILLLGGLAEARWLAMDYDTQGNLWIGGHLGGEAQPTPYTLFRIARAQLDQGGQVALQAVRVFDDIPLHASAPGTVLAYDELRVDCQDRAHVLLQTALIEGANCDVAPCTYWSRVRRAATTPGARWRPGPARRPRRT